MLQATEAAEITLTGAVKRREAHTAGILPAGGILDRRSFRLVPFTGWRRCLNVSFRLAPDLRLASVLDLSPELLRVLNVRGLLLDVDCTLKDYRAVDVPADVQAWMRALRENSIRLCLLSNGRVGRIQALADRLDVPFVAQALKPLPFGCRRAAEVLGVPVGEVAVIGDQLFADVLAGRLAGMFTILVKPTTNIEPWFTRLKRPFERCYLWWCDHASGLQSARRLRRTSLASAMPNPLDRGQ